MNPQRWLHTLPSRTLPSLALLWLAGAATAYGQTGVLGLVIDETRVREGATEASVVVRSTSARNLAAGTLAIEMRDKDGLPGSPYTALLGVEVLSGAGDAVANATFDPSTLRTEVTFSSASATINSGFGPLVILRYALDPALQLDRRFLLRVDTDAIALDPADGEPLYYFTEKGRLRVDDADADVSLEAEADHAVPGATAVIGAGTEILGEIASGMIEILYEPGFAAGPATASIHPAYGAAVIDSVEEPVPGVVRVTFHATGGDLNTLLPGPFLAVSIPTRADVAVGSRYEVILGAATAVLDGNGQLVEVERTEPEILRFVRARLQFLSGFDDGTSDDFWPGS
jgi:hypothetical protein